MIHNKSIINNLNTIKKEINLVCKSAKRTLDSINLVAVSKTIEVARICEAAKYGQIAFGENKVQEAEKKWPLIKNQYPDTRLHMIGPMQSNKVKDAIKLFDVIETVDREKIVLELKKNMDLKKQQSFPKLYVQINIGEEKQKNGCSPIAAKKFIADCISYGLNILLQLRLVKFYLSLV